MPSESSNLEQWQRRLEEMKRCNSATELVRVFGEPNHKALYSESEIWHYPLGIADGFLYSIHASVTNTQLCQIYMQMEPANDEGCSTKRTWWKRLFQRETAEPPRSAAVLLGDPELYAKICGASSAQRQHAAAVAAKWVVKRIGFRHPALDNALSRLGTGSAVDPSVVMAVEKLVERLDLQDDNMQESDQGGESSSTSAFSKARAASAVLEALSGDAANAVYEAIHAINDSTQLRQIVLTALSEHEKA